MRIEDSNTTYMVFEIIANSETRQLSPYLVLDDYTDEELTNILNIVSKFFKQEKIEYTSKIGNNITLLTNEPRIGIKKFLEINHLSNEIIDDT